ncbi:MAG: N-acyl-D-amino-acid deacylase family protein [Bacillota bacterium]
MHLSRRRFISGAASVALMSFLGQPYWRQWLAPGATESLEQGPVASPPVLEPQFLDCDIFLKGGLVIDGTGSRGRFADVAVKGDRIVAVGSFTPVLGARSIDVTGLVVAPGFIDIHTHTEQYWQTRKTGEMILLQGITSHIGANCGTSVPSIKDYFDSLGPMGVNFGLFVGYKPLRQKAVGKANRTAVYAEVKEMQEDLAQGLMAGAFGLSVGLSYWPQTLATTEELVELCLVVKEFGGFYSTHIRCEQDNVLESLEEAINIGFRAQVPVQYSHVKTAQKKNWGKMGRVLTMLEEAVKSGVDITGDAYAYQFSSLDVGSSRESIGPDDMRMALQHPLIMMASDGGLNTDSSAIHPRSYGNYPRVLGRFVREEGLLDLEEAVRKMTSLPAKRLGLADRGLLAPGYRADIAVFNPDTILDRALREKTNILATGVEWVLVNGTLAVEGGRATGALAGQPLKNARASRIA